ncbi:DUF1906 domain-containing protein [Sphingomonas aurantiaca]|uniref:Uncharacterized protein DUF1906 n=1 Tax=Sphingomonas aurantiaca TaxID=185949 RepID=A0A2T5GJ85_9SPHN|nr:DUF1906 domain-containing protein [Sphingomonas aurantiaca]PTQ59372.1 uncharacterized protein DUF1906 [Sphingomonas aurantiaca]
MPGTCGVWKTTDVTDADLGLVVGGYNADGAQKVETSRQPNNLWTVTATFPPCGSDADTTLVRTMALSDTTTHLAVAQSSIGMDCAADCTSRAAAIAASNAKVVGRYYRWPTSKYKSLTHAEAAALSKAGLSILSLWEWASDAIENFSFNDGVDQGTSAVNQALKAHQPPGTPIYFAVDFDASSSDVSGRIADYFKGVQHAIDSLKAGYVVGVYGSGRTCAWLLAHGGASRTWLADARKWAGYDTFTEWHVRQGHNDLNIAGLKPGAKGDYDSDEVKANAGFFSGVV